MDPLSVTASILAVVARAVGLQNGLLSDVLALKSSTFLTGTSEEEELLRVLQEYAASMYHLNALVSNPAISERLGYRELARVNGFAKSSMALSTILLKWFYAEPHAKSSKQRLKPLQSAAEQMRRLLPHVQRQCEILEAANLNFEFDTELIESRAYQFYSPEASKESEMPDLEEQDSSKSVFTAFMAPFSTTSGELAAHAATEMAKYNVGPEPVVPRSAVDDVRSISTSYLADVELYDSQSSKKAVKSIMSLNEDVKGGPCDALLDTGAGKNCISTQTVEQLGLQRHRRKLERPFSFVTADSSVQTTLVIKIKWRFTDKTAEYTQLFYILDSLPVAVVIGSEVIFELGFLMENPELTSLGLPDEYKGLTERAENADLLILGMKKLAKGEEQAQEKESADKAKQNKEERERNFQDELKRRTASSIPAQQPPSNTQGNTGSSGT